ncbi:uncharacterized protein LOC110636631 [Hevea brasiliensis]|uniref:uncharacterized protein LOC110636631 n=1 Tax=Hevea brasiliensis TaxID=3981 RepID=UPI0025FA2C7C|nr:uncharacterized protein LOC110636631 [Hevea brasiliensis]
MFASLVHQSEREYQDHPFVSLQPSSSSSSDDTAIPMLVDGEVEGRDQEDDDWPGKRTEQREPCSSSAVKKVDSSDETKSKSVSKEPNLDGLCCPICMEPWGSQGDHQVSCLPCGHVYGLSCIRRWLQPHLISAKKVQSLEAEIGSLKTERADLLHTQDSLLKIQDNLLKELSNLEEKQTCTGNMSFVEMGSKPVGFANVKKAHRAKFGNLFT